jgi:Fe-S-cluster-containing dehydrogenase component
VKRVFIDLDLCDDCGEREDCIAKCSYPYHPGNDGVTSLRELAAYGVICRQCESGNCINACTEEALEKGDDGILRRYNMRCISCKSCAVACPFGTIYPELVPYGLSRCDYCIQRLEPGEDPLCVTTCPLGAIKYVEIEPDESKSMHGVGENLVVKCEVWQR